MMPLRVRHVSYYVLGFFVALAVFLGIVWGPDLGLWLTLMSGAHSIPAAFEESVRLFGLALTDAGGLLTAFYVTLSLLIGADMALLAFYFKKYRAVPAGGATTGAFATFVAILGFGCAACGSLFLSLLATSIGGAGIAFVPIEDSVTWALRGVGLAMLALSLYQLIRAVNSPLVCPVE